MGARRNVENIGLEKGHPHRWTTYPQRESIAAEIISVIETAWNNYLTIGGAQTPWVCNVRMSPAE